MLSIFLYIGSWYAHRQHRLHLVVGTRTLILQEVEDPVCKNRNNTVGNISYGTGLLLFSAAGGSCCLHFFFFFLSILHQWSSKNFTCKSETDCFQWEVQFPMVRSQKKFASDWLWFCFIINCFLFFKLYNSCYQLCERRVSTIVYLFG